MKCDINGRNRVFGLLQFRFVGCDWKCNYSLRLTSCAKSVAGMFALFASLCVGVFVSFV